MNSTSRAALAWKSRCLEYGRYDFSRLVRCLRSCSARNFASSADSVSDGRDCSIECIIIQIVQLSSQVSGEHRRFAIASVQNFLGGGDLHALVIAFHPIDKHLNSLVGVLPRESGDAFGAPAGIARPAGPELPWLI